MGGTNINRFLDHHKVLESFANTQGCKSIKTESRKGLDRLTKGNYKIKYYVYEKDLD